jgi:hypothetical protein
MSDTIIDLSHEFETMKDVQEYFYSTDKDLADLRDNVRLLELLPVSTENTVHVMQNKLTKGFGCEPR